MTQPEPDASRVNPSLMSEIESAANNRASEVQSEGAINGLTSHYAGNLDSMGGFAAQDATQASGDEAESRQVDQALQDTEKGETNGNTNKDFDDRVEGDPDHFESDRDAGGNLQQEEVECEPEATDEEAQHVDGDGDFAIDEELLARALSLDIPVADAMNFGSNENLAAIVGALERVKAKVESIGDGEDAAEDSEARAKAAEDIFDALPSLDGEEYNEGVVKLVDGMKNAVKKVVNDLREEVGALTKRAEDAEAIQKAKNANELEIWFDKQIGGLGDEHHELLGKGASSEVTPKQLQAREKIANHLAAQLRGYQGAKQSPSREELFKIATMLAVPDSTAKAKDEAQRRRLNARSKQHINRVKKPGGRDKPKGSPKEEVAQMLVKKYNIDA